MDNEISSPCSVTILAINPVDQLAESETTIRVTKVGEDGISVDPRGKYHLTDDVTIATLTHPVGVAHHVSLQSACGIHPIRSTTL